MAKTILYRKSGTEQVRFWAIESDSDGFSTEWGVIGGEVQEHFEPVPYGKGTRNQQQQIESMVASKLKKRKEAGYTEDLAEAMAKDGKGLNDLGLPRAMLATPFKSIKVDVHQYYKQPKLDGHRCMVSVNDDGVTAYSRNGKPIHAIYEIIAELERVDESIILDGELYSHGIPLQTIGSWVKKRQELTSELDYWVYDCYSPGDTFTARLLRLERFFDRNEFLERVFICPTSQGVPDPIDTLQTYRRSGFEGAILRDPKSLYEAGKRSKGLVKVKSFEDDEFVVVGVLQSKDSWAILELRSKNTDKPFTVSAPGTVQEKIKAYRNRNQLIGKSVRVEYAGLTNDGVPFHPIATMWREKDDE